MSVSHLVSLGFALAAATVAYLTLKSTQYKHRAAFLAPSIADRLFFLLPITYTLVFATLSITSYASLTIDGYDLSIFDQVVWNSLHGRLFENSILDDAPLLIGQRFSPILLAFVPIYAVWSSPIVLMAVQTLAIAVGSLPVYWFARERVGHAMAYAFALAYLLFPIQYTNLKGFLKLPSRCLCSLLPRSSYYASAMSLSSSVLRFHS